MALALAATYPLWLGFDTRIQSLGDPLLNSYILAWGHHALTHQIWDFFQATIFWPNADALRDAAQSIGIELRSTRSANGVNGGIANLHGDAGAPEIQGLLL